jgi:hypothetical protein
MLKSSAARLVKLAAATADPLRPADGLVVLIYHRVGGGSASAVDLPPGPFAEQMEELTASRRDRRGGGGVPSRSGR